MNNKQIVEPKYTQGILETPRPAMMIVGSDQLGRDFQEDVVVQGVGVVCIAKGKTKEEAQANAQRIAKTGNMHGKLVTALRVLYTAYMREDVLENVSNGEEKDMQGEIEQLLKQAE